DWASLKGFEHDLDYSSYAESIQKLAEILVIIQLMNQGIFLLKSEILKEIQMKEDQTVKNDAETITEQYGDCIPNHFNLNSKSLIFNTTPFAAVYFQRQLTTLRQRP
ncbi:hypothetical protein EBR43_09780, partial [bacterium]|nr:hypothetical protein [bacterium]